MMNNNSNMDMECVMISFLCINPDVIFNNNSQQAGNGQQQHNLDNKTNIVIILMHKIFIIISIVYSNEFIPV